MVQADTDDFSQTHLGKYTEDVEDVFDTNYLMIFAEWRYGTVQTLIQSILAGCLFSRSVVWLTQTRDRKNFQTLL